MIDISLNRGETLTEFYTDVANRLNAKGKIPFRARKYTQAIVHSHVYKRINDDQVEEEINIIKNERRRRNGI